ncbi:MAG: hypothetical protein WC472_01655 [Candidatus Paceibacterota bacterium]
MIKKTQEEYCNEIQDKRLDNLEDKYDEVTKSITRIETNHLAHMETDVAWLKRFFWIIATASIGGLVTALINLMIVLKK